MPQSDKNGRNNRTETPVAKIGKVGRVTIAYRSGRYGTRFVQYMSEGDVDRLRELKEALAGPTRFDTYDVRGAFKRMAVKRASNVTLVPIDIAEISFTDFIAVQN